MFPAAGITVIFNQLFLYLITASPMEHEYRIREEIPIGSRVGNLVEDVLVKLVDFGLIKVPNRSMYKTDELKQAFAFKILNYADAGANCFEIKSDGQLVTTRRIDRESLCNTRHTSQGTTIRLMDQSSPETTKLGSVDAAVCPVTLHFAVYPVHSGVGTKGSSSANHVTDMGNAEQTVLQIRILIEDINDNAPYWPGHLQRFQVQFRDGDPIGERRTLPPAMDNDAGTNAHLRYELSSVASASTVVEDSSIPFSLIEHPIDGLYLYATKQIDREEQASYQLYLKAIDHSGSDIGTGTNARNSLSETSGSPVRELTATLLIDVLIEDINDNAPLFTQPIFSPSHPIPETTPVGKTVLVLNASDADSGLNGAFHFAFSKEHAWLPAEQMARDYFDVRPNGHVVIRRSLNVDRVDGWSQSAAQRRSDGVDSTGTSSLGAGIGGSVQFRFRVVVQDEAIRPYTRSSEATVIILVSDENDEAPVVHVKSRLPLTWTQSNPAGLRLDSGRFNYLVVEENQPPGTKIATIQVYDPDFDGTDLVECHLRTANFTLSNTAGEVHNAGRPSALGGLMEYNLLTSIELDREVTGTQTVSILCSDMAGHYTEQNVTVHITDRNDNAPQFVQSEFTYQVEENAPLNTMLKKVTPTAAKFSSSVSSSATVTDVPVQRTASKGLYQWNLLATDADTGSNAEIQYHVLENGINSTRFTIDPVSGALSTAVVFDRESVDQYTLQALAIDKGNPPLTSSATIKVTILDVNDNAPQFSRPEYSFHVAENQPRSTQIGQVNAIDLDSDLHGPIAYFLSTDRDALSFRLDRDTGILRSRQPLDREEQARYVFRVLARDASPSPSGLASRSDDRPIPVGTVQLTGTATVTVIVDDENDNWPVFVSPNATANTLAIAVDETLGHKLAYIQAQDADQDENGLVSYHIRSGNTHRLFGLDSATGLLYLAGNLGQQASTAVTETVSLEGNESAGSTNNWSAQLYQPSFHVLTLEACDHGRNPKPHCTLFSNLKIIIKNHKEIDFSDYAKSQHQILPSLDSVTSKGSSGVAINVREGTGLHSESFLHGADQAGFAGGGQIQSRQNASEIVIICLSVVFTVVLLATLLLICLLRKRSVHYFNQKRISADNNHEARDPEWEKTCSASQLGADPAAAPCKAMFEIDQSMREDSLSTPQASESKMHDQELPNYPGSMDMLRMSKDQYHLLTRTVDMRRRNLQRDYHLQAASNEPCTALISGNNRFPTLVTPGHMNPTLQNGKLSHASDYQTLDYLGLVSSAIPQRYPHLYSTQRRLTYSPVGSQPARGFHSNVFAGIRPLLKTDSILLTHMNRLSETETRSPLIDCKPPDSTYLVTHSHSRSQPQPMDRRSIAYPLLAGTTFCETSPVTMAPQISCPTRPGIHSFQSPLVPTSQQQQQQHLPQSVYQPFANSKAITSRSAAGGVGGAIYGIHPTGYPIQSHTYYDIRQADQQTATHSLPKSKSQQISRAIKVETSNFGGELEEEQFAARTDPTMTENDIVGTLSTNKVPDSCVGLRESAANMSPGERWRHDSNVKEPSEWLPKSSVQPNANSLANISRFVSSPVESPKYVAAAYKEASFV